MDPMVQRRTAMAMSSTMLHRCNLVWYIRFWLGSRSAFLLMLFATPSCISLWRSFFLIPNCNSNFWRSYPSHSLNLASYFRHLVHQSAAAGVIQAFDSFLNCITICFDRMSLITSLLGSILAYTQIHRKASCWRCSDHVFSDLPLERSRRH
jgi:hypothetical protein